MPVRTAKSGSELFIVDNSDTEWKVEKSSPHPNLNVVLFADGHVQTLAHQWLTANQMIWSWQNTTAVQLP